MRKNLGLVLTDKVEVFYKVDSADKITTSFIENAIAHNHDTIAAKLGGHTLVPVAHLPATAFVHVVNNDPIKPLQGVVGVPAQILCELTLISQGAVLHVESALAACGGNRSVLAHLQDYLKTVAHALGQHATHSVLLQTSHKDKGVQVELKRGVHYFESVHAMLASIKK